MATQTQARSQLRSLTARTALLGKHIDEALFLARGYPVHVVYGSWGANRKPRQDMIVVAVNEHNHVTKVW